MTRDDLFSRFESLTTWSSGGQRAPHKPLLILYALGEWARGQQSVRFADARQPLTDLLRDFGPPRQSYHPEYPFWRLQTDGVWDVTGSCPIPIGADGGASTKSLLDANAMGQFSADIRAALTAEPALLAELARAVVQAHFPESLHQDILQAVGLELADFRAGGGGRDPNFRKLVLNAYGHRCAVCGFQVLLSGSPIALEAAHIKWHQADGPAVIRNGLALCVMHHKIFDLGAFTISHDCTVLVSDVASGLAGFSETLLNFHGRQLLSPVHSRDLPDPKFIDWHAREVFRGETRPLLS
jgi:putative restriction endonuclease